VEASDTKKERLLEEREKDYTVYTGRLNNDLIEINSFLCFYWVNYLRFILLKTNVDL